MDMLISTTPLSFTEFSDFVIASVDWFIPSLHELSDLNGWILKMYLNGSMFYSKSESEITGLVVTYYNTSKNFVYIPYICVHLDYQGHGIASQLIDYVVSQLASHVYGIYLEVRKGNKGAVRLYKKLGFCEFEDRGVKYLMKKEIQKQNQNLEQLNQHISVNEQSIRFMDKKMEEYKETEMNYTLLKDLSDTANGEQKGKTKISFERFVQSVYFDLILAAANERLSVMSEQRYYLLRKEENDINKGSSGLELEILDEWTGKRRNVRSLSGGESFKAALSLALGLSDVIQNKKGGIQVDTIFIDEGFGTLDADSLNKAMQIINSLSLEGNKLVGIISHVDELKDQIDQKIEVYKDHAGSKVK